MLVHVAHIISLFIEAFPTNITFKVLLASMGCYVHIESILMGQRLPTQMTHEMLLSAMDFC